MNEQPNFLPENFRPQISCLTINTDASFCQQTKAGGFAFYIICDSFKIKESGKFTDVSTDPSDAEIKALANAFLHLTNLENLPLVRTIIINTDSTNAIKAITDGMVTPTAMKAHKLLSRVMELTGCKDARFRWVKSHTRGSDRRTHVNNWCDEQAKIQMRKHRKELQTKNTKK